MQPTNEKLNEEIKERKRAQEKSIKAKEAAEGANQAKSDFIGNISHELRTPLAAILGFIELTIESEEISGKLRNFLDVALESSRKLLDLINKLLDFSMPELGKMTLDEAHSNCVSKPFKIKELVGKINKLVLPSAKQRAHSQKLLLKTKTIYNEKRMSYTKIPNLIY